MWHSLLLQMQCKFKRALQCSLMEIVCRQCAYTLCTMHDLLLLLQLFYLHCLHGLHCLHCSNSSLHSAAMVGRPMALLAPPCAARALVELRGLAAEKGTRDTEGKTANYSSLVNKTAGQEHCRPRKADR